MARRFLRAAPFASAAALLLMSAMVSGQSGMGAGPVLRLDPQGKPQAGPDARQVADYAGPSPAEAPDLQGLPAIPSNFDTVAQMPLNRDPPSPVSATDPIGAFRFTCQAGQINWDDPIVYPGQPNASPHLHQWFGNTSANALSTFASLRGAGESTCMGPLNRSAYWVPAMLAGGDTVVRPDYVSVYYKRYPASARECSTTARSCLPLPHGLRYVFGYDMARMGKAERNSRHFWKCVTPQNQQRGENSGRFDTLDCQSGDLLIVSLPAPDCWDGVNLDSADHRSHMAYQEYRPSGGPPVCPNSHPYLLPQFTVGVAWTLAEGDRLADWHLASDRVPGMPEMPAGSSFHSDWYGAWDDVAMNAWTENCINGRLSCVDGALGNGKIMKRPPGFGFKANPRLVPAPQRPGQVAHH